MEYVVILAYFAVLLGIGVVASRRVGNLGDYYVGGKRLGYWVVAFSARASGESAWLYLGLTGLGALVGARAFWIVGGELAGVAIAWFLMARPFKHETDRFDSITIPDYLVSRFHVPGQERAAQALRLVSAIALALFVTIYVSAQIDATGKAFDSFLGWGYYTGAIVGFGIVLVYTLFGGFVAVAWSDLFQGILMLVGLCALPIAAAFALADEPAIVGGLSALAEGFTSLWGAGGPSVSNALIIVGYVAIGLGFMGSPQVFVRFIAIRDESEIRAGRWIAIAFTILTDGCAVLSGMLGRALLVGTGGDFSSVLGADGEQVLPELVFHLFPAAIVGVYIAAVLAAIMSTIDSLLLVASSAVTRDVYQQMWKPELRTEALTGLSRIVTLVLALVALGMALIVSYVSPDRTIFWYVIFGWSGIAATFCPVIILALFWDRYNVWGALASMITGALSVPLVKFGVPRIPGIGPLMSQVEELAPAFVLSLTAGVVVTFFTHRPSHRPWAGQEIEMADISSLAKEQKPGFALQQPFYRDAEIFEREISRIFLKSWLYAGHASQVPESGDYFLFEIAGESVIVARNKEGEIRALLNVCRHRGSRVCLEASGNQRMLVCPYHAWTYDLDGALRSASHTGDELDKQAYGLKRIQARVFHGMIFINFDDDPISFDPIEQELDAALTPYALDSAKVAHEASYLIRANWKLTVENYCECYHCRPAHPEYSKSHSLAAPEGKHQELWDQVPEMATSVGLSAEGFNHTFTHAGGVGNDRAFEHYPLLEGFETGSRDGKPVAPLLGELKRFGGLATDFQIGSLTFFLAYADHVVSYRFIPVSAEESRCDISWLVNGKAEEGKDYTLDDLIWLWDVTTIADKQIIESNQAGVNSRFYTPGPYTEMEEPTREFVDWYLQCMVDEESERSK